MVVRRQLPSERYLKLGIQISYFRPRVRIDNPYSEAIFRTMKYLPEFPNNSSKNLPVTRECSSILVYWYNCEHQHSELKFVTPD